MNICYNNKNYILSYPLYFIPHCCFFLYFVYGRCYTIFTNLCPLGQVKRKKEKVEMKNELQIYFSVRRLRERLAKKKEEKDEEREDGDL